MKKIILTTLVCIVYSFGFSQAFKTEHSAYFKKESEKDIYKIVFPTAYGFTTLHHLDNVMMDNTKAMVLTKYDQTMTSIESMTFNLPKLGLRASDLQNVIELEDRLIVLSKVMDKKMAKHQINAQVYSEKNNSVSDNKVLASFPISGYSKSGFYNITISPDQTKIAIVANMPFEKNTKENAKIWVYDNMLNLLWKQSETLNYESERAYNESVFIDNTGLVFLNKTTNAYKKTRENELLTFNGTSVNTQKISSPGFIPMKMQLITVNGKPMLTGFYWDGKKTVIKINSTEGNDNNGAFLYDIQANNLIGIHEWSTNLNTKDLKSLQVVDVKIIGDDIFLIGEKQLTDSAFRKQGNTTTMELDYTYTFGPSIVVNLDTKGTLKGFTPLFNTKTFTNYAKENGSLSALYLENGLRVFSNDSNNDISLKTYFSNEKTSFSKPMIIPFEGGTSTIPSLLPKTVRAVKNYGIIYYITNYGDRYWYNKTTW